MISNELILSLIGIILGIMGLSYVWFGDTVAYGTVESMVVGGGGALVIMTAYTAVKTAAFDKLMAGQWSLIIPIFLGILVFSRLTRFRWAARYPVALMTGIGIGVTLGATIRTDILNAIVYTITRVGTGTPDPASSWIILVIFLSVICYFLFSIDYTKGLYTNKYLNKIPRLGRLFFIAAMGSFGLTEGEGWLVNIIVEIMKPIVALLQALGIPI